MRTYLVTTTTILLAATIGCSSSSDGQAQTADFVIEKYGLIASLPTDTRADDRQPDDPNGEVLLFGSGPQFSVEVADPAIHTTLDNERSLSRDLGATELDSRALADGWLVTTKLASGWTVTIKRTIGGIDYMCGAHLSEREQQQQVVDACLSLRAR